MASIVLSSIGAAVGQQVGGPIGAYVGARIGSYVGSSIDNSLFGSGKKMTYNGARLADLAVQSSTYGKMIPAVYGTMRLGGNIIWSQPIKETGSTTTSSSSSGGKGGGGKSTASSTTYSYSITLAIGICEGPIDEVLRIWADAKQLDLSTLTVRIYKGDETQLPDTLIQSVEGAAFTPAYRGLAYVVFENFEMEDYGNRIPNFTFEVKKKALATDYNGQTLENMITGMVMIPGAGEFVYDTVSETKIPGSQVSSSWVQSGSQLALNTHTPYGKANALVALDQLKATCPNVSWVSVVIAWFGTSMDAGTCTVLPGVEYQTGATTSPGTWSVGGFTRATARLITQVNGGPQYGGTPDDTSLLRYLTELRARGYKIAFYPLMYMDVAGKSWRGDLTGSAAGVSSFFTKTNGYNAFINRYATLTNGYVDAFVIGSEMKGLTKVTDSPGNYPAVNQLVSLAASVKSTLGSSVKVTYAADWSEYHHADGGWYNMDPLWASPNIDVIGIDAYFPLSDAPQNGYDVDALIAGWTSGEGYDWYYSDPARTIQASLSTPYAWKNIAWFWNNTHTNPNATTTAWTPQMKKIWFTEYGFPSIDGAANQPNVFYDPTSSLSAFPYYSKGRVDVVAQRTALTATQAKWAGSSMIERMFVWTWDARPFPYWPDLSAVWSDGANWKTGHWVQGKLGTSSLATILLDICKRAGLADSDVDVTKISNQVDGFIINQAQTFRASIESLQNAYFFDVVESDNKLKFNPRGGSSLQTITEDNIIAKDDPNSGEFFIITRTQEIELPKRVNIVYLTRLSNYQSATQYSQRQVTSSLETQTIDLPIVCDDQTAKTIADKTLFSTWQGRLAFEFDVPIAYAKLEPTDVISVTVSGVTHRMRITSTRITTSASLRIQGVAEDVSTLDFYTNPGSGTGLLQETQSVSNTSLVLLDIPAMPSDDAFSQPIRLAGCGLTNTWTGAAVYRSDDAGANYGRVADLNSVAAIGSASTVLTSGSVNVFDEIGSVTVLLLNDASLQSVTPLAVLNGANAALLGYEIIQFTTATLIAPGKYTLTGLLRGRLGTEWAVNTHVAGERFVLLDGAVAKLPLPTNLIGLLRPYKGVTYGSTLSATTPQDFICTGVALKPYSPVHITGSRDGSQNLILNWIRRARLGGDWRDGVDVPLNEAVESYQVDIMNGVTVVRTIATTMQTASYTAAQQITDFGSTQASISVKIYQISAVVGRGYAGVGVV
jgi:hypothetical protein